MDDNQLQTSFSVTVIFLNETDMKQDLPDQHQELTLQVHRQLDDVSLNINDGKQKQELLQPTCRRFFLYRAINVDGSGHGLGRIL